MSLDKYDCPYCHKELVLSGKNSSEDIKIFGCGCNKSIYSTSSLVWALMENKLWYYWDRKVKDWIIKKGSNAPKLRIVFR